MATLSERPAFEQLGADECWRLLGSRTFGRICLSVEERVHVGLTSYVVQAGRVYFRAAAFGAVARRARSRPVTLEVDDVAGDRLAGWVVTATGLAHHVDDAATLASLWSPVRPVPWESGLEPLWIALAPDVVEGRRLRG